MRKFITKKWLLQFKKEESGIGDFARDAADYKTFPILKASSMMDTKDIDTLTT
jgi:hypothetical protein